MIMIMIMIMIIIVIVITIMIMIIITIIIFDLTKYSRRVLQSPNLHRYVYIAAHAR